jgi:hypothetical protein
VLGVAQPVALVLARRARERRVELRVKAGRRRSVAVVGTPICTNQTAHPRAEGEHEEQPFCLVSLFSIHVLPPGFVSMAPNRS